MKKLAALLISIMILFAVQSCRKNRLDPYQGGVGPAYFPTSSGSTWIYLVDSIKYDKKFAQRNDTFQYRVKNVIESEFIDHEGKLNQSYTRYISKDSGAWIINGSFSARLNSENVVRNQNNYKEIILKFPIQEFDFWDGNSLNNSPLKEFEYLTVHVPKTILGNDYDSTCTVIHENVLNKVQTFYEENTYAVNRGMIHYKKVKIDEKDIDTQEPMKGTEVEYQLIRFER